jgi:hypothetical protein
MDKKSAIVYSMHRSASTFLIDFLKRLAAVSNMRHGFIDPSLEALKENVGRPVRILPKKFASRFSPKNAIYGPFRRFVEIPALDQYNSVMILRDPRDVIVSLYYAQIFSHGPPPDKKRREEYLKRSQKAKKSGIDKMAIEWSDNMLRIYLAYMKAQKEHEIPLITYAEMVTNFKGFLAKFLDILELPEYHHRMLKYDKFKVKQEDVYAHKRQVAPKDHERKLKPATINQLNRKLRPVLSWLGVM